MSYNIWAILVAAVANNVIGALWYGKSFFGRTWMREVGLKESDMPTKFPVKPFAAAIVASLVLGVALAWANAAAGSASLLDGVVVGLIVGIGMGAAITAPHYAFAGRSLKLFLIDQGHSILVVVVMSAIIGLWR
ncbi:MAG: DUF1761 domain-containing protein [Candidatus Lambdaproteobacteria bacterium]|nr:DUF1761 domain-containing protein [Candidatus Lambdaproteobacteria bacterium]